MASPTPRVRDMDAAVDSVEQALAGLTRHGATAHLPSVELQLAQILLRRADRHDAARAAGLLVGARAGATAIGAAGLLEQIDALGGG